MVLGVGGRSAVPPRDDPRRSGVEGISSGDAEVADEPDDDDDDEPEDRDEPDDELDDDDDDERDVPDERDELDDDDDDDDDEERDVPDERDKLDDDDDDDDDEEREEEPAERDEVSDDTGRLWVTRAAGVRFWAGLVGDCVGSPPPEGFVAGGPLGLEGDACSRFSNKVPIIFVVEISLRSDSDRDSAGTIRRGASTLVSTGPPATADGIGGGELVDGLDGASATCGTGVVMERGSYLYK